MVLIGILVLHGHFIPLLQGVTGADHRTLADYGETYIIWGSLFDTLACLFVGGALLLQWYDLRKRDSAFANQLEAQRLQTVLFPFLTLFQQYVMNLEYGALRGRRVCEAWREHLEHHGPLGIQGLMADFGSGVEGFHRHLEGLLRFILLAGLSIREKNDYISLLQSLLSDDELVVVRNYCECKKGESLRGVLRALKQSGVEPGLLLGPPCNDPAESALTSQDTGLSH